ncbi:MAG: prolipoprotein diacylglyceryl transferase family protein [Thermoleophilia bacterium]
MHPVLLSVEIFGRTVTLNAYPVMLVVAGLTAAAVGILTASFVGLPSKRAALAFGAALAGAIVGARLLHLFTNVHLYSAEPARIWALEATGFSLYGGLLLGGPAGLLVARSLGLGLWRFVDAAAAGAAAGVVLNRVGCFLQGCCYGRPTDLPWGVEFPPGSPAWVRQIVDGAPDGGGGLLLSGLLGGGGAFEPGAVHPTQLYELGAASVGLLVVAALFRRRVQPGTAFLVVAVWFTAFRLANARLRWPPTTLTAPVWFYPAVYGALLAVLGAVLIRRLLRGEGQSKVAVGPASAA